VSRPVGGDGSGGCHQRLAEDLAAEQSAKPQVLAVTDEDVLVAGLHVEQTRKGALGGLGIH
jgi:hypothetical protein